jgi:hypothetical protein
VSFAAITLCVASQRMFIVVSVYFVMTQSGNFWVHPRRLPTDQIVCIRQILKKSVGIMAQYISYS